jgi:uncharacterized protein YebE (UPF0316 family)
VEWLHDQPALMFAAIFLARVLDVSIGTIRTITVVRGYRLLATVLGFFEVLIWVAAAGQVLTNLNQWYLVLGWAGGFATGNAVGIWLEAKLAIGTVMVRAVSENVDISLGTALRDKGYSVTELDGRGDNKAPVDVVLIAEGRRRLPDLLDHIRATDPDAFYTIDDIRTSEGVLLQSRRPAFTTGWRAVMKRK